MTDLTDDDLDELQAERDELREERGRLQRELFSAMNRIEWAAGLIHNDAGRDKAFAMAEQTRAALEGRHEGELDA
jgi:hypothetical protein